MQLHREPELVIRPGPFQSHLVSRVNVPKRLRVVCLLSRKHVASSIYQILAYWEQCSVHVVSVNPGRDMYSDSKLAGIVRISPAIMRGQLCPSPITLLVIRISTHVTLASKEHGFQAG